ncbi:hypothetical protein [Sphingobacterium lumbrici]|uniref:hypothetical protein n=1 Tax=Sphingobacterium lumbrici TaxID=2559600 RepID=UPI0015E27756|nr:hypothetical protein [Sphingobacterium lumbrici]
MRNTPLVELIAFIKRIPSVKGNVSSGFYDEGFWWIKCATTHSLLSGIPCWIFRIKNKTGTIWRLLLLVA